MPRTKLLYIVGRGHSGSTLLAELLGLSCGIESVGELTYTMHKTCGCGRPFPECSFWQSIASQFTSRTGLAFESGMQMLREQAHIGAYLRTLFSRPNSEYIRTLSTINAAVADAIGIVSKARLIIDGSKQPSRALLLARTDPDVQLLHLIRMPDDFLASYYHGLQRGQIGFMRRDFTKGPMTAFFLALVAISWPISNAMIEVTRLFARRRVLRVRYEDLCSNPSDELNRIGDFANADFSLTINAIAKKTPVSVGHIIGGNSYVRAPGGFIFDPGVGRRPLPLFYRILIRSISWPFMIFYGYPVFGSNVQRRSERRASRGTL